MQESPANALSGAVDLDRLLKTLCYALRHAPRKFGIALTDDGYTSLDLLVSSFLKLRREYRETNAAVLREVICNLDTERFEVCGTRIRAKYGHSVSVYRIGTQEIPPEILFHGTSLDSLDAIREEGLQPMDRFLVHLTSSTEYATSVGNAKGDACLLRVRARLAYEAGVLFYRANSHVWLANEMPAEFLVGHVEVPDDSGVPIRNEL